MIVRLSEFDFIAYEIPMAKILKELKLSEVYYRYRSQKKE